MPAAPPAAPARAAPPPPGLAPAPAPATTEPRGVQGRQARCFRLNAPTPFGPSGTLAVRADARDVIYLSREGGGGEATLQTTEAARWRSLGGLLPEERGKGV